MAIENYYELVSNLFPHKARFLDQEYNVENTKEYFKIVLKEFNTYLEFKHKKDFLYSSIAYFHDNKKTIEVIPYYYHSEGDKSIQELLDWFTQVYIQGNTEQLTFTQILLCEKNFKEPLKILLYSKSTNQGLNYIPTDLIEINLSKIDWNEIRDADCSKETLSKYANSSEELTSKFCNRLNRNPLKEMGAIEEKKVESFNRLVSIYVKLSANIDDDRFFYFLKPQSFHEEFNGVLLLGFKKELSIDEFTLLVNIFYRILSQIAIKKIGVSRDQQKKSATKSAISQVMARNLSHNIGSHVMNNLIDGSKFDEKNLIRSTYEGLALNKEDKDLNTQLAYFINYVKCRMDYMSEVTFGIPNMQTTRKIYADVFRDLDKVRLLLNHISGITDFNFSICFQYNGIYINEDNDISVAFPSDVIGCQAFYNVLENIIRNSAKHCQVKGEKTIFSINIQDRITIDDKNINDNPRLYYCVEITDGINIEGSVEKISNDEKKDYCNYLNKKESEIDWEDIDKIDWLVHNQNIKLNQSVLGSNNQLRTNSLGLLEMEASSAFLRQIDIPEIESDDYQIYPDDLIYNEKSGKLNILKAIKATDNISVYSLGYRMFLSKPQEFLFVGKWNLNDNGKEDKKIKSTLINHGIWFKTEDEFFNELEAETIFNHQFVLYDENSKNEKLTNIFDAENNEDNILALRTSLPIRLIDISSQKSEICDILKENNAEYLDKRIWEIWEEKINVNRNKIHIFNSYDSGKPKDDFQIILFDHLFDQSGNPQTGPWEDYCKIKKKEKRKIWMEALSSNGQNKLPNFQKLAKNNDGISLSYYISRIKNDLLYKTKIFESYFNKIIAIDERIQNFSSQKYIGDVTHFNIFKQSNVLLPKKDKEYKYSKGHKTIKGKIDLDSKNYDDNLIELIELFIENNLKDSHFLLIHFGILERMYKDKGMLVISDKLIQWSKLIRVIVTSGRGKQSLNLPTGVCYVNLSSVSYAFIENRNKFSINYLLNQARK